MDTNNYCIKICDCSEVKYCYTCFKEYVKTSILADPIKINSTINGWHSPEQKVDLAELITCSICHKAPVLGLIESIIDNMPGTSNITSNSINTQEIGDYLLSLDFFSETVPHQGDFKWYILFNQDGRIRYNLVPLERIDELDDYDNNISNNGQQAVISQHYDDNETKLRKAGFINIFEITHPTPSEHRQIKAILHQGENQPTEKTTQALLQFNPTKLKLL